MRQSICLPYYEVRIKTGKHEYKTVYAEANLSLKVDPIHFFVLTIPGSRNIKTLASPLECQYSLQHLVTPREYERIIIDRISVLNRLSRGGPSFRTEGVKGIIQFIISQIFGLRRRGLRVDATSSLEARLGLMYLKEALGISKIIDIVVSDDRLWIKVAFERGSSADDIRFYVETQSGFEEFRVLHALLRRDANLKDEIIDLIK